MMSALELRIPPVAMAGLFAAGMWLLARAAPALAFTLPGRLPLVSALVLASLGLVLAAGKAFHAARTTVNPRRPSEAAALIQTGIYRHSRNPMYLALLLLLVALALFLAHALSWVLLPAFVACMDRFQILPEERALRLKFGSSYAAYLASVRRWL